MRRNHRNRRAMRVGAAAACVMVFALMASRTSAQGCAIATSPPPLRARPGREALRHGILLLLVPAVSLFFGILHSTVAATLPADPAMRCGLIALPAAALWHFIEIVI